MADEFWYLGYHREYDSRYYDEDGFALSVPRDDPRRAEFAVLQVLSGEKPVPKLRKDYTEQLKAFLTFNTELLEAHWVRTQDPMLDHDLIFDFGYKIKGVDYRLQLRMERRMARTQEELDENLHYFIFRNAAASLHRKLVDLCDHQWAYRGFPGQQPAYRECAKCGLKDDIPGQRPLRDLLR